MRFLVIAIVAAALLAVAAVASAAPAKDNFQLKGEVYPNALYKIEMENKAGRKLRTVKAGTYRIKIEDKATIHNFRLRGPGVNKATSVPGKDGDDLDGQTPQGDVQVPLRSASHRQMRGTFRVT